MDTHADESDPPPPLIDYAQWERAMIAVKHQALLAVGKHGQVTRDVNRGVAVMVEELGEIAECALEATRVNVTGPNRKRQLILMGGELAQLAGYVMLLMIRVEELSNAKP